jgi:acetyltransferase-like isoleucine patch superfamily enzyme
VDCSGGVTIGAFTTFAGFRSQILTHSIDLETNLQTTGPVSIGKYCFIGTNSVLLMGSRLPDFSVLGAKSLLNKPYEETHWLYAGVPARPVKRLRLDLDYFHHGNV